MHIIRSHEVNTIILSAVETCLTSCETEILKSSLEDFCVPSMLIKEINHGLADQKSKSHEEILKFYINKQRREDKAFSLDESSWVIYHSLHKLGEMQKRNGKKMDDLNTKRLRAKEHYDDPPSNHKYTTKISLFSRLNSLDDYFFEKKQYYDLKVQIRSIKDQQIKNELLVIFKHCFMDERSENRPWQRTINYHTQHPLLCKKLYWAMRIQARTNQLNELIDWQNMPKISQDDYLKRKQRTLSKLPKKPNFNQCLNFLLPNNRASCLSAIKKTNEAYQELTPAEMNQVYLHLLHRSKKTVGSSVLDISQIESFCYTQQQVMANIAQRINVKRNGLIDKTLLNLKDRIEHLGLDSYSCSLQFIQIIEQWSQEPSPYHASKTNGDVLKPNTCMLGLFKSQNQSILQDLINMIPNDIYQMAATGEYAPSY